MDKELVDTILESINNMKENMNGRFDTEHESIAQINKFLLGNGQKGLLERQTRTEGDVIELKATVEQVLESIQAVNKNVAELTTCMKDHLNDKQKHNLAQMVFNKNTLIALLASFVIVHEVVESGGPLLQHLLKLIGL